MKGSLVIYAMLALSYPLFGQNTEKAINVRPVQNAGLNLEISGLDQDFLINEPIKFSVRGSHDFYLYVFNVDKKHSKTTLLLPNQYDQVNFFKAGASHKLPEQAELRADGSGHEHILFVASKQALNLDTSNFKSVGEFLQGDYDDMDQQLKAIKVRVRTETPFVEQITVKIKRGHYRGNGYRAELPPALPGNQPAEAQESAFPFLSTNQTRYLLNDTVRISFGADRSGFIYLFHLEDHQEPEFLRECAVEGDRIYRLSARTEETRGPQAILAIFSKEAVKKHALKDLLPASYRQPHWEKSLSFSDLESEKRPYAYYPFEVN